MSEAENMEPVWKCVTSAAFHLPPTSSGTLLTSVASNKGRERGNVVGVAREWRNKKEADRGRGKGERKNPGSAIIGKGNR